MFLFGFLVVVLGRGLTAGHVNPEAKAVLAVVVYWFCCNTKNMQESVNTGQNNEVNSFIKDGTATNISRICCRHCKF